MPKLSVIIPCYYNKKNIPVTKGELIRNEALFPKGVTFEYVLIDDVDLQNSAATGRTKGDSPEIDGEVIIGDVHTTLTPGSFVSVRITDATEYDLFGEIEDI